MKKFIVLFAALFIVSNHAYAEVIGYVDMQKVFMSYDETKKARAGFEKKQNELKKELEEKQAKLVKAQEENKKPEEIQKLVAEIQEDLQPKQQALIDLNNQLMAQIRNSIVNATRKVSKEYGVDMVLDKGAVLTGGFDLTDFVIDQLNK